MTVRFHASDVSKPDDVIDRGMFVLLYLTPNFCTDKRLEFLSSEVVFITRIEQHPMNTTLEMKRG